MSQPETISNISKTEPSSNVLKKQRASSHLSLSNEVPGNAEPVAVDRLFLAAMSAANDGCAVYDVNGNVTWCNASAVKIFGVLPDTKSGHMNKSDLGELRHPDGSAMSSEETPHAAVLSSGSPCRNRRILLQRADGGVRWLYANAEPIFGEDEATLRGVVVSYSDITERTKAQEQLRLSEERWMLAIKGSTDGVWDWNIVSNEIFFSERTKEIIGFEDRDFPCTTEAWNERIHPDDLRVVKENLEAHFDGYLSAYSAEFRIRHRDGHYVWVLARGIAMRNQDDEPYRMAGSFTDVSDRKQSEERLVSANSRFEALIRDLKAGVLVEDSQRQVVLANQAFCDLMLIQEAPVSMMGANCARTFQESKTLFNHPDAYIDRVAEILAAREPVTAEEVQLADGRVFERDYVPVFLTEEYGGHYWMYRDVTERKQYEMSIEAYNNVLEDQRHELEHANELLSALATTDGLTGVRNRRAFEERLHAELHRCRRHKLPVSLIMLDVDKFKQYNDAFGHPAGDEVLKTVANVLQSNAREYDLVARFGGEEFIVVLPGTAGADAIRIAERFRHGIETAGWTKREVTASFGVAQTGECRTSPEELIAQADAALYRSKEGGRNRVTMAASEEHSLAA